MDCLALRHLLILTLDGGRLMYFFLQCNIFIVLLG